MSDDTGEPTSETGSETEGGQPAGTSETASEESSQPPMDTDEMADLSAVAEEVAEETAEATSEESSESEGGQPADTGDGDQPDPAGPSQPELSIGDIYCNGLGLMAALGRSRYGSADDDQREELADEYADMARQIDLDEYLDQYLQQRGALDELGPGQAVVIGTLMFGGMVMVDDPDMAVSAVEEVRADA
jgi:hypothetical protein